MAPAWIRTEIHNDGNIVIGGHARATASVSQFFVTMDGECQPHKSSTIRTQTASPKANKPTFVYSRNTETKKKVEINKSREFGYVTITESMRWVIESLDLHLMRTESFMLYELFNHIKGNAIPIFISLALKVEATKSGDWRFDGRSGKSVVKRMTDRCFPVRKVQNENYAFISCGLWEMRPSRWWHKIGLNDEWTKAKVETKFSHPPRVRPNA